MGAAGIIVPHLRGVEVGRAVTAAARYAPDGVRGACPAVRAVGHVTTDWAGDLRRARGDILVFGLIEDVEGVENVEEIATESGLDGLVFGPFDLSMEMGLDGDPTNAAVREMGVRVRKAAASAGIQYLALPGWDDPVETLSAEGVLLFNVSADRGALFSSFTSAMAEARKAYEVGR